MAGKGGARGMKSKREEKDGEKVELIPDQNFRS